MEKEKKRVDAGGQEVAKAGSLNEGKAIHLIGKIKEHEQLLSYSRSTARHSDHLGEFGIDRNRLSTCAGKLDQFDAKKRVGG